MSDQVASWAADDARMIHVAGASHGMLKAGVGTPKPRVGMIDSEIQVMGTCMLTQSGHHRSRAEQAAQDVVQLRQEASHLHGQQLLLVDQAAESAARNRCVPSTHGFPWCSSCIIAVLVAVALPIKGQAWGGPEHSSSLLQPKPPVTA